MKRPAILLLVVSMVATACYYETPGHLADLAPISSSPCQAYESTKHRICFDTVCLFISDFLQEDQLRRQAKSRALGGYFDGSLIPVSTDPDMALRFYPCFKTSLFFFHKVYVAMDEIKYVSAEDYNSKCEDDAILSRSTNQFVYDGTEYTQEAVSKFLREMTTMMDSETETATGEDVMSYAESFRNQYTIGSEPINIDSSGAFNENEIHQLLNQKDSIGNVYECKGIRYFFGYDKNRNENKVRLILIGVNAKDGSNLLSYKGTGEEAVMIEKEWPPDY